MNNTTENYEQYFKTEDKNDMVQEIEINYNNLYKIIMIGDSGVGKTSLLTKYLTNSFPRNPFPTIASEFATKIVQMKDGGYVKAQIWDTTGQEKYKSLTSHHYRKCLGAILVYDITSRSSFANIVNWLKDVKELADKNCIIVLVGNKLDLVDSFSNKREVTKEEGEVFAYLNKLSFYETSAFNKENVNEIFEDLVENIYNDRRRMLQTRKSEIGNSLILSAKTNNMRFCNPNHTVCDC